MTLEPLITQEDVERKQLFRTRGGRTATVIGRADGTNGGLACDWRVEYHRRVLLPWVTSNGFWTASELNETEHDLISRIPQEPAMESQVVDGCCPKHGSTWVTDGACRLCRIHKEPAMDSQVVVEDRRDAMPTECSFKDLPYGMLFKTQADGVYLRLPNLPHHGVGLVTISGKMVEPWACAFSPDVTCQPLPHLRLRLVLEERT